jgi:hypothetical protein
LVNIFISISFSRDFDTTSPTTLSSTYIHRTN